MASNSSQLENVQRVPRSNIPLDYNHASSSSFFPLPPVTTVLPTTRERCLEVGDGEDVVWDAVSLELHGRGARAQRVGFGHLV